ncbi:hypothetical protein J3E71DRAFT_358324 [Bipolaris maydis]|nr:hypothetical protein J3E71DRAFT_358324 [Bipolaris maydis]
MRRCVYVNEPLSLPWTEQNAVPNSTNYGSDTPMRNTQLVHSHSSLPKPTIDRPLDHFGPLPRTRLPRARVLELIHHWVCIVLSNIAFQYYPLDLETWSNPFVVSWWPLALNDPALFHVSLQTASLDLDLKAQNGVENSELLMADSIALVRRRVEDQSLACRDETIDSVVTLAAIEFGKGNTTVSSMHIEGVKKMVQIRGGIHALKLTSPLTARMVAWVSIVLMQEPQFDVQNDETCGDAIAPIQEWIQLGESHEQKFPQALSDLELESTIVRDVIMRLHNIFDMSRGQVLSTTDLHDLFYSLAQAPHNVTSDPENLLTEPGQTSIRRTHRSHATIRS